MSKIGVIAAAFLIIGSGAGLAGGTANLIENGNFESPEDPLRGWVVDYAWSGNEWYVGNIKNISITPHEAGRSKVLRLQSRSDAGTKVESPAVPFDIKNRYRASLYIKGGPYRIYLAGYQWKPGIRPHDDPSPEELRMAYRGKAETGRAASWTRVSVDIPGDKASDLSLRHLGRVRFIRLFAFVYGSGNSLFIDDVSIAKMEE